MIAIMSAALDDAFSKLPSQERNYGAGDAVFDRGAPIAWLHRVEEGEVRLVRYGEEGKPVVLQRARKGAFLAEASLFSDRYHCSAEATGPARLRRYRASDVKEAFAADPAFATAWAAYVSLEVQRMRVRAEILSLRTIQERLDAWALLNNQPLPQRGSWRWLAEEIGVAPEALYRTLARRRGPERAPAT